MGKRKYTPPADPYAAFRKEVERMPTSALISSIVGLIVTPRLPDGLAYVIGSLDDRKARFGILSAELDARVPAEHKHPERWPSDYEGSG